MASIAEIRKQYPQYDDLSDQQLSDALHSKFYSDMPKAEFEQKIGLQPPTGPAPSGFDFRDAVAKEMRTGKYAPPVEQANVEGNPEASFIPGPVGDALNTFNAFSHRAMDVSTGTLGDEIYAIATSPFREHGLPGLFNGKGYDIGLAINEGLQPAEERAANIRALNPQAYDAGSIPGSLALIGRSPMRTAAPVPSSKRLIAQSTGQGAAAGAAFGVGEPGSLEERAWGGARGLLTGGATGLIGGKIANDFMRGAVPVVPSAQAHLATSKGAFTAARNSGAVVAQPKGAQLMADMRQVLVADGAITPSGKIAGYPKIQHALDLADDYATAPMTMEQLLKVRKQVAKAAKSFDPDERRLAVEMLKALDNGVLKLDDAAGDFIQGAGQQAVRDWAMGREFYHVGKKSQSVENLIDSAKRQSKKSAAVPAEQAMRNKFESFTGKEANLRGFKPDEVAALKAVSEGSTVGNAAKQLGRLAPTTLGGIGFKAGVPYAIGHTLGGPAGGAALAGTSIGLGVIGKIVARLSTDQKAKLASIIVRNGGKLPTRVPQSLPAPLKNALGNLILTAGASSTEAQQAALAALGITGPAVAQ